ncbi:MAG: hypothetical protein E7G36_00515 [Peptoniphilus rhinitidis]|uniref:hypothetical protein n=1 Tax=Peptoniphilus rhinitidis TaxID=1175452 RepID=UPI00290454F9|nr:hypothetical protein [Peptoniphilus rhinitidis]MDU2109532.1 hypothetical protein [Peptoniphilus lacydonensis]MDU3750187.1 hypothetical protein [Peptoniphilus rhinitidis]
MKKAIKLSLTIALLALLPACKKEVPQEKPEIIGEGNIVTGTEERHRFDGRPAIKIATSEQKEEVEDFKSKFNGDYFISKGEKRKIREDYTVGMDLKEGYYLLEVPNKSSGYFKVIRDGINYEKKFDDFFIIEVTKGDYLRIDNVIFSRLENPYTGIKDKLPSGIHVVGKDVDKALYKTSEDFEGYLISPFEDQTEGPNVKTMEKNQKYALNEIATDNSIVFISKGFIEKNTPVKAKENTDNNTDNIPDNNVAKPAEEKVEINPETKPEETKPEEQTPETDKFEIGG